MYSTQAAAAPLTAALSAAAVTLVVVPAAEAACAATPTTKAFEAFGDYNDYSLVPTGASSRRGRLVAQRKLGGQRQRVREGSRRCRSKSLAIDAGGQAVSPTVCVDLQHPTFRFFARRTSGSGAC